MKRFMIVGMIDEEMVTTYADDYTEARDKKMEIECGFGGYAELYERKEYQDGPSEYVLLEA